MAHMTRLSAMMVRNGKQKGEASQLFTTTCGLVPLQGILPQAMLLHLVQNFRFCTLQILRAL